MSTFYEEVGGEAFFNDFVSQFYARVATDPILRPMYPEKDMQGAALRLKMFLAQYWGGPSTYSEERGHPRLRMRHAGFKIDIAARDAWLACAMGALDGMQMPDTNRAQLREYLEMAAHGMINSSENHSL
ncbi:globin [Actinobacteria bacterium IMCC26103]|nr:globin [Actinobacteria bacterium IMCC26103]